MSDEAIRGALEDDLGALTRVGAPDRRGRSRRRRRPCRRRALERRAASGGPRQRVNSPAPSAPSDSGTHRRWPAKRRSLLEDSSPITTADVSRLSSLTSQLRRELEDRATIARAVRAASRPPTRARPRHRRRRRLPRPTRHRLAIAWHRDHRRRDGGGGARAARWPGRRRAARPLARGSSALSSSRSLRADHPDITVIVLSDGERLDDRLECRATRRARISSEAGSLHAGRRSSARARWSSRRTSRPRSLPFTATPRSSRNSSETSSRSVGG